MSVGMEEMEGLKGSGNPDFPGTVLFGNQWDEGSGCGQGDKEGHGKTT